MLQLFITIQEQLQKINPENLILPTGEVNENDTVVGVITDLEQQKLFTLARSMQRDSKIAMAHIGVSIGEEKAAHERQCLELQHKGDVAMNVFWAILKDKHSLWNEDSIGIRDGWKVVKIDLSAQKRLHAELAHALFASM